MLSRSRSVGCVLKEMSMICLLTMATVSHADVGIDQMNLKGRSLATPEPPVPKKPPHHEKIPTPPLPKGHPHPPPEKALLPEPPKLPEAFEHMKPRPLGGAPPGPPHPPVHEDPEIHEPLKPSGSADEPTAAEPSTESTPEDQGYSIPQIHEGEGDRNNGGSSSSSSSSSSGGSSSGGSGGGGNGKNNSKSSSNDMGSGGSSSSSSSRSGGGGGSSTEDYEGCLYMTKDELEEAWPWGGNAPPCDGGISEQEDDGGNGGSGGGGNGGGGSGGGGEGGGSYDDVNVFYDFEHFDIHSCDSYSNNWMWDLALTCENTETFEGCQCTAAGILFDMGSLQCADSDKSEFACPKHCSVCQSCMMLMGCKDVYHTPFTIGGYGPFLIASAVALGVSSLVYFGSKKGQKHERKTMGAMKDLPVHLVPVPRVQSSRSTSSEDHVWLAPMIA